MMARPRLHLPVQALVCVAAFGFGLPLAIALFPQTSEVRKLPLIAVVSSISGNAVSGIRE